MIPRKLLEIILKGNQLTHPYLVGFIQDKFEDNDLNYWERSKDS